jgi:exodeoxyribonuclease V gamma subunit
MARWVQLGLARRDGIAANLDYPLPAAFVWRLARARLGDLPERDPLERERMAWRVFSLVPEHLGEPAFAPLARYLADDPASLKRWQLAEQVADAFDRYQLYRPALIAAWDAGAEPDDWQARLWRRLTQGLEDRHRGAVVRRLLASLAGAEAGEGLPERISVFALSSLPPLLVEVLHALALHTAVELYLHAPTPAFWADLVSHKELARRRLEHPEAAELWEVGNSLLASWGRQGQALQDLLLSREVPTTEDDAFAPPPAERLLGRVQRDLFELRPVPDAADREEAAPDGSLEVHACHGPLRECQVLHDRLLALFEADPSLRPEDVLVMIPEVGAYAPYLEAVFDQDAGRGRPFIPWNLSDVPARDEDPLAQVLLGLLDLPESRFTHSEVLSYLDVPEVAARFGLDAEGAARARAWLAEANLRWGLDGAHKARLGLPEAEENTWAQAERRLFAGYALGDAEPFAGIAPVGSVEGAEAELLGRLWHLVSRLAAAAGRLAAPRPAAAWRDDLGALVTELLGEGDDAADRLQRIRDALADLAEHGEGSREPLPRLLVRSWLAEHLGAEPRRGRYFSGGVTVCGMRPMRSLPFRVICVLGLDEQAFPRRDRPSELDRMRRGWRPGDPRKGEEDRYLFLETLLCARERLHLSYVGRDIRRDTERQPSVLVAELLDYLEQHYRPPGADGGLAERLVTVHPLQPFSPRSFTEGGSYDADWAAVARALAAPPAPAPEAPRAWPDLRLPEAPEALRDVPLARLERFLRHPVRHFVGTRLQVELREAAEQEDEELFEPDGLTRYGLGARVVAGALAGRPATRGELSAEGLLPHGAFADLVLQEAAARAAPLAERLAPLEGRRPEPALLDLVVEVAGGPLRLAGPVPDLYPDLGVVRWRPGRLRGEDLLALWAVHLAWCACDAPGARRSSLHGTEASFVLAPVAPEAARGALAELLAWYWEGLHRPLPVLPRASHALAEALAAGRDPERAARQAWEGNPFRNIPGDRDDPWIRLVLRGVTGDPLAHDGFAELARALHGRVLAAAEEG